MSDVFSFGRGRLFFDETDLYGRIFSQSRSKTAEHNIYLRSKNYLDFKNEKTQKKAETEENKS